MPTPIVTLEFLYPDGSGAPATVLLSGYYFAADFIGGEVRLTGLTGRTPQARVIAAARRAYERALRSHPDAGPEWFAKNDAMYRKAPQ